MDLFYMSASFNLKMLLKQFSWISVKSDLDLNLIKTWFWKVWFQSLGNLLFWRQRWAKVQNWVQLFIPSVEPSFFSAHLTFITFYLFQQLLLCYILLLLDMLLGVCRNVHVQWFTLYDSGCLVNIVYCGFSMIFQYKYMVRWP